MRHKAYRDGTRLKLESKQDFIQDIESHDPKEPIEVSLRRWSDKRSLRQNRLLWTWNTEIGEWHGYTSEEMHEVFLYSYAPKLSIADLDGQVREVPKRSSAMTVKEMTEYLNCIEQHAAEWDIPITIPPDKDELLNYQKQ